MGPRAAPQLPADAHARAAGCARQGPCPACGWQGCGMSPAGSKPLQCKGGCVCWGWFDLVSAAGLGACCCSQCCGNPWVPEGEAMPFASLRHHMALALLLRPRFLSKGRIWTLGRSLISSHPIPSHPAAACVGDVLAVVWLVLLSPVWVLLLDTAPVAECCKGVLRLCPCTCRGRLCANSICPPPWSASPP